VFEGCRQKTHYVDFYRKVIEGPPILLNTQQKFTSLPNGDFIQRGLKSSSH
jgi:hypothetical protein